MHSIHSQVREKKNNLTERVKRHQLIYTNSTTEFIDGYIFTSTSSMFILSCLSYPILLESIKSNRNGPIADQPEFIFFFPSHTKMHASALRHGANFAPLIYTMCGYVEGWILSIVLHETLLLTHFISSLCTPAWAFFFSVKREQ
jgi:hypothetical protein